MIGVNLQIEKYSKDHSTKEDPLLAELASYTQENIAHAQMQTGHVEGILLRILVKLSGAKKVLEIGTYTGYSALAMAMGMPEDGKLVTLDFDKEVTNVAKKFWDKSPHGKKIELILGDALEIIKNLEDDFDFVFIDADKNNYINYYKAVLPKVRSGGMIVVDNALRNGAVLDPQGPNDKVTAGLNDLISTDNRVEAVMLTVRDGITIVIKK